VDAGLMMANTISFVFAMILGYILLRRRIGRLGLGETSRALGRLVAAAVTAAIPAWFLVIICQHTLGTGKVGSAVTLVAGGLLLIVVYVVAALLYRARDITNVVGMVRARVGR
jgi:putative peptidoglycan lipid II flippase